MLLQKQFKNLIGLCCTVHWCFVKKHNFSQCNDSTTCAYYQSLHKVQSKYHLYFITGRWWVSVHFITGGWWAFSLSNWPRFSSSSQNAIQLLTEWALAVCLPNYWLITLIFPRSLWQTSQECILMISLWHYYSHLCIPSYETLHFHAS